MRVPTPDILGVSAMSSSATAEAVLALHRFGLGPRPGSITAIAGDPRGALIPELEQPSAALAGAAALPSGAKAYRAVTDANPRRQAKAKVAERVRKEARQQPVSDAPAMMASTDE